LLAMNMVADAAMKQKESEPVYFWICSKDGVRHRVEARFIYLAGYGVWVLTDQTETYHQQEQLALFASTDELTGVHNRRTGLALLQQALQEFKGDKGMLTICYLDIDNLKQANDAFGHQEGDSLIRLVTEDIKKHIRRSDFVARMGGDEFLIVFPDCNAEHARLIVQNIVISLEERNQRKEKPYAIGFSYGIESWEPGKTYEDLVALADRRMYYVKRQHHKDDTSGVCI